MLQLPTKAIITAAHESAMERARVGAMAQTPFLQYFYYDVMVDYPTFDISTLATNGLHLFYNPDYLAGLEDGCRIFAWAHEIFHAIQRHPQRMMFYLNQGTLRGLPYIPGHGDELFNIEADYIINADLVVNNIGRINPAWLFDPTVEPEELVEDRWVANYKKPPEGGGGGGGQDNENLNPQPPTGRSDPPKTKGGNQRPDKTAQAQQGRFDKVLTPYRDMSGKEHTLSDGEFMEAVAKAAAAAKAMGKLPGSHQQLVDRIMEPQVSWRDRIRAKIVGKMGHRRESWLKPDRRRLVLNPIIYIPGKQRFGADTVVVVIDNSGSVASCEPVFYAEVGGVLNDVRPRQIVVIWCDAAIRRVEYVRSLDDIAHIRETPTAGGGGTSFVPPFEKVKELGLKPQALIYLTDLDGRFPSERPQYDVLWCCINNQVAPFGETIKIEI